MATKKTAPVQRSVTTTWSIANIEWRTSDGYITTIHWVTSASDGKFSSGSYGSVGLSGDMSKPYSECDEAWCIAAAQEALGPERVASIEDGLAADIEDQRTPESGSGVPWEMAWADVTDSAAPSNDFRWTTTDPEFIALKVGDRIKATDPANAIPVGATCLEKREDGVSVWDIATTLSGSNVPFKVAIEHVASAPEPEEPPAS